MRLTSSWVGALDISVIPQVYFADRKRLSKDSVDLYAQNGDDVGMTIKADIQKLAQLAVVADTNVTVDRQFIGRLVREDGWHASNWHVPWHILYLIHEGFCQITIKDKVTEVVAGQAILFDPRRIDAIAFSTVMRYSELRFEMTRKDQTITMRQPVMVLHHAYPLAGYIDQLAREVRLDHGWTSVVICHWLGLILAYADRFAQQAQSSSNHLTTAQLDAMIHHVQENLGQAIQPVDLAQMLQLSPDYFARLFKRTLGQSPRAWLVSERIRHACQLLQYSMDNIDQIAQQVGYSNTTHFCRQFRQRMGTTPAAWREKAH